MTQTQRAAESLGQQLRHNPAIEGAIDTIVSEVARTSAKITDARPPIDALRADYDTFLANAAAVRGKGLLYPYIGSGAGNGALVELLDGSVKWDMICGIGVHFFGHADPDLVGASLRGATTDTLQHGNLQSDNSAFEFGQTLLDEARRSSRLNNAFLSTSGAVANESALKVCYQKHAPASRAIAFKHCFMGRTVTMAQIGDSAAGRAGIPLSTQIDYVPFFDEALADDIGATKVIDDASTLLQEYIERYPRQHACFIFELVQGEGGFNTATRDFFKTLMDQCKASGIAVWDDEIQSFGRTERMFAYDLLDLGDYVDVFCVGKMTQACATLYTDEYNPKAGLLSGTFTSTGSAFTVGNRILQRLRDGDYYSEDGSIAKHHAAFREQVKALAQRHPDWFPQVRARPGHAGVRDIVGGTGGMCRFTPFGGDKTKVTKACRACFDEGVIVFYCGHDPYHIRMLPPLGVMKLEDWPRVFECVERGLARVAG